MRESRNIVVGYDGSVEAGHAVRWAARQADLRGCGCIWCTVPFGRC